MIGPGQAAFLTTSVSRPGVTTCRFPLTNYPFLPSSSSSSSSLSSPQLFSRNSPSPSFPPRILQGRTLATSSSSSTSSTTTSLMMSSSLQSMSELIAAPIRIAVPVIGVLGFLTYLRYRGAIQRRLKQVKEESWIFGAGVTMTRVIVVDDDMDDDTNVLTGTTTTTPTATTVNSFENLKLLELNPEFIQKYEQLGWNFTSLGNYMQSLRPKQLPKNFNTDNMPKLIQQEIEAGLAAALLKALGPNLGQALLPAVGFGPIQKRAQNIASSIATRWIMSQDGAISESSDKGGIPVSLLTLLAASNVNAKLNSGNTESGTGDTKAADKLDGSVPLFNMSAMEKMKLGEVVKGPSFVDDESIHLIPQNEIFIVSEHFNTAIQSMEARLAGAEVDPCGHDHHSTETKMAQEAIRRKDGDDITNTNIKKQKVDSKEPCVEPTYDPEDRRMGEPVPINPRLFPDLYLGFGDALCSHTKREVLKMRLLSLLLNRLGANYHRKVHGEEDELFTVRMSSTSKPITTPSDFIEALQDEGHTICVVPSSRLTTFGIGMCIKEPNGSWTNVPLGVFLESGYESKDGNMAPAMMPHSGLDMYISGPLAGSRADGTPSELAIQHFIGIEGFCGWKSHGNVEVPFNQPIQAGDRLTGKDAVRAARIAALYGNVLNGLATDLKLPFGGYGVTAVCNDSAAIVQQCLYGENTIYPMTSLGRYMLQTMRYAQRFGDDLNQVDGMIQESKDMRQIVRAMKKIPSDINASPANAASAAKRLIYTLQPELPFLLMKDSKHVMESILREEEEDNEVITDDSSNENNMFAKGETSAPL